MKAYIESIGVISRCAQSVCELTNVQNGGEYQESALPIEFDSQIPSAKMRRNSRYNKIACTAADNALRETTITETFDRRRIGTIISTGYGPIVNNTQFAETVKKGVPGLCSPYIYAGAVPNSCIGQICILNGFKGVSTVLTGGDPLEYSSMLLAASKADLIICGSVEEYSEPLYNELGKLDALNGSELSEGSAVMMLTREKTEKTLCSVSGFSSASLGKSPLLHKIESGNAEIIYDILKKCDNAPDAVFNAANGTYFDDTEIKAIKSIFPDAHLVSPKKWAGETLGCGYMMNTVFAASAIRSGKYKKVLVTGVDMIGNYCTAILERT